jgi:lipoprotein-releasing system ATP-binding protein
VLEVDAISKTFDTPSGPLDVLRNVTFNLAPGRRLVVMGPSGSGKSTLLAILGGLDDPSSGTVHLDGRPVRAGTPAQQAAFRNRNVGFVFQDHRLLDACSAIDHVLLPVLAESRVTGEHERRATALLDRVGLLGRAGHLPSQLSGGERQRVAVARALMLRPRLLLADEPTGQLDASTSRDLAKLLADLSAEHGSMLIVVTHADAVAGALVADGCGVVGRLADGVLTTG